MFWTLSSFVLFKTESLAMKMPTKKKRNISLRVFNIILLFPLFSLLHSDLSNNINSFLSNRLAVFVCDRGKVYTPSLLENCCWWRNITLTPRSHCFWLQYDCPQGYFSAFLVWEPLLVSSSGRKSRFSFKPAGAMMVDKILSTSAWIVFS